MPLPLGNATWQRMVSLLHYRAGELRPHVLPWPLPSGHRRGPLGLLVCIAHCGDMLQNYLEVQAHFTGPALTQPISIHLSYGRLQPR